MDAQGPDKVRPYIEKAEAQFTTVVDEGNILGDLYGFKAIPNGYLIDEKGVLRYKKMGGFDIRRSKTAETVERWAAGSSSDDSLGVDVQPMGEIAQSLNEEYSEANRLFLIGLDHYRNGAVDEALACWRQGFELEPDNLIIRKQIWAVENPEKFYAGEVDYDWQREQIKKGL